MPSNEERGYVLRRVMRRAIRYGVKVGLTEPFLYKVVDVLIDTMGNHYSELKQRADFIREVVKGEEERFRETLDKGLSLLDQAMADLETGDSSLAMWPSSSTTPSFPRPHPPDRRRARLHRRRRWMRHGDGGATSQRRPPEGSGETAVAGAYRNIASDTPP